MSLIWIKIFFKCCCNTKRHHDKRFTNSIHILSASAARIGEWRLCVRCCFRRSEFSNQFPTPLFPAQLDTDQSRGTAETSQKKQNQIKFIFGTIKEQWKQATRCFRFGEHGEQRNTNLGLLHLNMLHCI